VNGNRAYPAMYRSTDELRSHYRAEDPDALRRQSRVELAERVGLYVYVLLVFRNLIMIYSFLTYGFLSYLPRSVAPCSANCVTFLFPPADVYVGLPLLGILGSVVAAARLVDSFRPSTGLWGAAVALIASTFSGVVILGVGWASFGPIGAALAALGLAMLVWRESMQRRMLAPSAEPATS